MCGCCAWGIPTLFDEQSGKAPAVGSSKSTDEQWTMLSAAQKASFEEETVQRLMQDAESASRGAMWALVVSWHASQEVLAARRRRCEVLREMLVD